VQQCTFDFTVMCHQNIRGLSNKSNELLITVKMYSPNMICLAEHHMKVPEILQVNLNSYILLELSSVKKSNERRSEYFCQKYSKI
jgi:hypothetical protein